ncbi:MAG: hypothetical protein WDO24_27100 [Pseudomonadota bacterium]
MLAIVGDARRRRAGAAARRRAGADQRGPQAFPVETLYLERPAAATDRIEDAVAGAVRRAVSDAAGDILVFLPGARRSGACSSASTISPTCGSRRSTAICRKASRTRRSSLIRPAGENRARDLDRPRPA